MLAILLFSILVPSLAIIVFTILQLTTDHNFLIAIYSTLAIVVLLIIQHAYFYYYNNLLVTAVAYSSQYLLSIIYSILITGGINSPIIILLVCSPFYAYITIGLKAAFWHLMIIALFMLLLFLTRTVDLGLPNIMPDSNHHYVMIVVWLMAIMVISLCLFLIDRYKEYLFEAKNSK